MANSNPFYIEPGGDYTAGLTGLSNVMADIGEKKREEDTKQRIIDKFAKIKQGAVEAHRTGDPDIIAEYSLANPEMAQALTKASQFRSERTEKDYMNSLFSAYQNPTEENITELIETRQNLLREEGVTPEMSRETDTFLKRFQNNPEEIKKNLATELAFRYPEKWKAYKDALKEDATKPYSDVAKLEADLKSGLINQEQYDKEIEKLEPKETPYSDVAKLGQDLDSGLITQEQYNQAIKDLKPEDKKVTPYTDIAKLGSDLKNKLITQEQYDKALEETKPKGATPYTTVAKLKKDLDSGLITPEDYETQKNTALNPKAKTKIELTTAALNGDVEAKNTLEALAASDVELAKLKGAAAAEGKIAGLHKSMGLDATAQAVYEGRETIDRVKNTFGVPIQEVVRKKVLEMDSNFNFLQPAAVFKSLNSSLMQQQKNRGAMGSFVANINGQVDKLEKIGQDIIKRAGVRALDMPWRELNTRFIGSGHERVFEAYMKEISAEIYKLSQGSTASVAMLPEAGRKEWEKIHDVNLSMKELTKVLNGTREMANIRLGSVDDEIEETIGKLGDIKHGQSIPSEKSIEYTEGQTATGPGGKRIIFRNGRWEDM